jgi:hypothetical protein
MLYYLIITKTASFFCLLLLRCSSPVLYLAFGTEILRIYTETLRLSIHRIRPACYKLMVHVASSNILLFSGKRYLGWHTFNMSPFIVFYIYKSCIESYLVASSSLAFYLGCPRNEKKSVRTETNRNKICFCCVLVCFVKPNTNNFGLFRCFEPISKQQTNRTVSKQTETTLIGNNLQEFPCLSPSGISKSACYNL